jgi:hypothetical protein
MRDKVIQICIDMTVAYSTNTDGDHKLCKYTYLRGV